MKRIFLCLSLLPLCPLKATDDCASLADNLPTEEQISRFHFARGQLRNVTGEFLDRDKIRYDRYTLESIKKLGLSKEDIENVLRTTNSIVPLDDYGSFRIIGRTEQKKRLLSLEATLSLENPHEGLVVKKVEELISYEALVVVDGQLLPVSQLSPGQFQQAVGTFFDTRRIHYSRNVLRHIVERNISQGDIEYVLRNAIKLKASGTQNDPNFFQAIGSTREIPWLRVHVFFGKAALIIVGAKRIE